MEFNLAIKGFELYQSAGPYATSTIKNYQQTLKRISAFLGNKEIEKLHVNDFRGWMIELKNKGVSQSTRQYHWKVIKSFAKWIEEEFEIDNIAVKLKMPTVPKPVIEPYSAVEVKKLLIAATKTSKGKKVNAERDQLVILFLLDTGIRVSELCRIKYKDINIQAQSIHIHYFETGKKSRDRVVFLGKKTSKRIWKTVLTGNQNDYFFTSSTSGEPLNRYSVKCLLSRIAQRSGVSNVYANRFRHTFAVEFLRNGGNALALQRLMGHATLEMTKRYVQFVQADLENAHKMSSPVDVWKL